MTAVAALGALNVTESSLSALLDRIAEIAVDAFEHAAFAGMTLLGRDERPVTAIFTSVLSPEIDAAQYRSGKGPCLDAWRRNSTIVIDDTKNLGSPYQEFCAEATEHGVRSTLSLPLTAEVGAVGALNLYATVPGGFVDEDLVVGIELARVAGLLIQNSAAYWGAHALTKQLDDALASRATVEQAKETLMAAHPGLDDHGAFDLLRRASQHQNVKLREVARRVVEDVDDD
jgi:GAF domain-containing protein